jgi:hypothetical protein
VSTTGYSEGFEVSKNTIVTTGGWDSSKVSAHSGIFSIGALNYPANANLAMYVPSVRGNGTPLLRFWTVCRTTAGKAFGNVEATNNFGKSWTQLFSLSAADNAEWTAGNNLWVKKEASLSAFPNDTIFVRFRLTNSDTTSNFGWLVDDIELMPIATGVAADNATVPLEYSLSQNFPNPFNPTTRIQYSIKERGIVSLTLYDILGKQVATLVHSEQEAGQYRYDLNANQLSSGIYFYRLQAGGFVDTKKLLLVR